MRLEPLTPPSEVEHSTNEPLPTTSPTLPNTTVYQNNNCLFESQLSIKSQLSIRITTVYLNHDCLLESQLSIVITTVYWNSNCLL